MRPGPRPRPHPSRSFNSQYTSIAFTARSLDAGVDASVGSVGDAYDNALAETTIGLYKTELIHRQGVWRTRDQVELAALEYVVSRHSRSWLAAVDGGGVGRDADIEAVPTEADEIAADRILVAVSLATVTERRTELRACCGLAKATAREWLERDILDREQVHQVLANTLIMLVEQVFPTLAQRATIG